MTAILSVALSSAVLAEERTYTKKITGTVISVDKKGVIVIDTGKEGRFEILLFDDVKTPKVGEKVTAHCNYHNRGRFSTDKIEKLGNAEGAVRASPETAETPEFEAAKQEYEQSPPDESARSAYVTKLAKIRERQIQNYWKTGDKNFDSATEINEELRKHPAPANSDSKKLSQLLVGKWQSPRRVYIFRANGKWGSEDGPVNSNWRINGNQLIKDGSRGGIILLSSDYFIYAEKDAVFFHARVNE